MHFKCPIKFVKPELPQQFLPPPAPPQPKQPENNPRLKAYGARGCGSTDPRILHDDVSLRNCEHPPYKVPPKAFNCNRIAPIGMYYVPGFDKPFTETDLKLFTENQAALRAYLHPLKTGLTGQLENIGEGRRQNPSAIVGKRISGQEQRNHNLQNCREITLWKPITQSSSSSTGSSTTGTSTSSEEFQTNSYETYSTESTDDSRPVSPSGSKKPRYHSGAKTSPGCSTSKELVLWKPPPQPNSAKLALPGPQKTNGKRKNKLPGLVPSLFSDPPLPLAQMLSLEEPEPPQTEVFPLYVPCISSQLEQDIPKIKTEHVEIIEQCNTVRKRTKSNRKQQLQDYKKPKLEDEYPKDFEMDQTIQPEPTPESCFPSPRRVQTLLNNQPRASMQIHSENTIEINTEKETIAEAEIKPVDVQKSPENKPQVSETPVQKQEVNPENYDEDEDVHFMGSQEIKMQSTWTAGLPRIHSYEIDHSYENRRIPLLAPLPKPKMIYIKQEKDAHNQSFETLQTACKPEKSPVKLNTPSFLVHRNPNQNSSPPDTPKLFSPKKAMPIAMKSPQAQASTTLGQVVAPTTITQIQVDPTFSRKDAIPQAPAEAVARVLPQVQAILQQQNKNNIPPAFTQTAISTVAREYMGLQCEQQLQKISASKEMQLSPSVVVPVPSKDLYPPTLTSITCSQSVSCGSKQENSPPTLVRETQGGQLQATPQNQGQGDNSRSILKNPSQWNNPSPIFIPMSQGAILKTEQTEKFKIDLNNIQEWTRKFNATTTTPIVKEEKIQTIDEEDEEVVIIEEVSRQKGNTRGRGRGRGGRGRGRGRGRKTKKR